MGIDEEIDGGARKRRRETGWKREVRRGRGDGRERRGEEEMKEGGDERERIWKREARRGRIDERER